MKKLALVSLFLSLSCVSKHKGDGDAKSFTSTFYPEAKSVTVRCQEYDTDRNGYVSCTAKADDKMLALECPVNENLGLNDCNRNTECRLAKGAAPNQNL